MFQIKIFSLKPDLFPSVCMNGLQLSCTVFGLRWEVDTSRNNPSLPSLPQLAYKQAPCQSKVINRALQPQIFHHPQPHHSQDSEVGVWEK